MLAAYHELIAIRQKESQSFDEFAAALLSGAVFCQFCGKMDVRLRDQFVIGL